MKNRISILLFIIICWNIKAQVGINTDNPKTMLDINGNASIRQVPETNTLNGYEVMVINKETSEVSQINPDNLIQPIADINKTSYSAKKVGGISLLGVSLFSSWKQINFIDLDRVLGSPISFSNSDHSYIVHSTGIYAVNYHFKYGSGIQATLLSGGPGIGIIKKSNDIFSVLDTREFSGISLGLASLSISEANINALYSLQAGDKLFFGLSDSGVLGVSLLGSSSTSFYVYKVSN